MTYYTVESPTRTGNWGYETQSTSKAKAIKEAKRLVSKGLVREARVVNDSTDKVVVKVKGK